MYSQAKRRLSFISSSSEDASRVVAALGDLGIRPAVMMVADEDSEQHAVVVNEVSRGTAYAITAYVRHRLGEPAENVEVPS